MQKVTLIILGTIFIVSGKAGIKGPRRGLSNDETLNVLFHDNIIKPDTKTIETEKEKQIDSNKNSINQFNDELLTENHNERRNEKDFDANYNFGRHVEKSLNRNDDSNYALYINVQHKEHDGKGTSLSDLGYEILGSTLQRDSKHELQLLANNARIKRAATTNHCALLHKKLEKDRNPDQLQVRYNGKPLDVVVMSTNRAPSRAMAALLAAAIRHKAGYEVETKIYNRTVSEFAATLPVIGAKHSITDNHKIIIHVDANRETPEEYEPAIPNCPTGAFSCGIAGTRLQDMGEAPSVNVRLFAVLSNDNVNNSDCSDVSYWLFYRNHTALQQCGFISPSSKCIPVLVMPEVYPEIDLKSKSLSNKIPFCEGQFSNRTELNQLLEDDNKSFHFIDYDLGYNKNESRVQKVELPTKLFPHIQTVALQLADLNLMLRLKTKIGEIVNMTKPQPKDLREVLYLNESLKDIDEAACYWANRSFNKFSLWTKTTEMRPWFVALICDNVIFTELNEGVVITLNISRILRDNIKHFKYDIYRMTVNCSDPHIVSEEVNKLYVRSDWNLCGGVAAPAVGSQAVAHGATNRNMQLVFYDVPSSGTILSDTKSTITISGGLQILVRSVLHFFKKQNWSRFGVLSEDSPVAKSITAELEDHQHKDNILYKEKIISKLNRIEIAEVLSSLKKENVRVFFINADFEAANLIACEAAKLGMTDDSEYAFIAREWQSLNYCLDSVQVFTISYWWRGGDDTLLRNTGGSKELRSLFNKRWGDSSWPLLAAPLADALLLMMYRLETFRSEYPKHNDELHSTDFMRFLNQSEVSNVSIAGVAQNLNLIHSKQHNPLVFVTAWRGNLSNLIAIWRAQSDTNGINEIIPVNEPYFGGKIPNDGRVECTTTTSGEKFNPFCHTPIWACAGVILAIFPIALWWMRRVRLAQNSRRERETLMRLLSRCEKTASVLEPHLVDRSALQLYEELGSGHFGRVRFGMLRASNRLPTPVAAKTLRDDAAPAEEAEFLREGSTMALLSHEHVISLVGVCADADGPPLLLMEHAFFGDLLKYLRQRRHLAEISERDCRFSRLSADAYGRSGHLNEFSDPEARHVSPTELTRLAREAAAALDYLSSRHILHRDVRAANCLVDAHRVLKLADFGMARNLELKNRSVEDDPEESEDYKYICRRRGVFPVPWMAPESLERGEFSRASDVWALGVLILEIATLGARPYGSWKPMQILSYVRSGRRPPLPRDVSYHTCELTEMCWSENADERASAKKIYEYLLDYSVAVRAALQPAWPEPDCVPDGCDSGFGEKEAEHEWPKGADLRVSTL